MKAAEDCGIRTARNGAALTLSIDRPQVRNALDPAALDAIRRILETEATAPDLRVVVIRGLGESPFSAGYDLGGLTGEPISVEAGRRLQAPIRAVAEAIAALDKPVVGAARRYAIGAALDVFAHCDFRVAEATATFRLPAAQLGVVYPVEGVARLVATMGRGFAERLLMLAEPLSAEELLKCGFLHRTWPADAFEAGLEAFADGFQRLAPQSLAGFKRLLALPDWSAPDAIDAGYEFFASSLSSADSREGVAAAKEKRAPRFTGH